MSRLEATFNNGKKKIINIYCTAGFPSLNSTLPVMEALQENGADIIELGMPYSDPLADGEIIQNSSTVALQNGMTIQRLFEQLADMRSTVKIPVILMGYMNPVLQYGFESFCASCAKAGIDGLILPDLPAFEYETMYKTVLNKYGLHLIFLVTPETAENRVRQLDALSSGFLYAVSSSSTTGNEKDFRAVETYLSRLKSYQLGNPVLVGFGIKDKESFERACQYADGAIIGSAYIRALEQSKDVKAATATFMNAILN